MTPGELQVEWPGGTTAIPIAPGTPTPGSRPQFAPSSTSGGSGGGRVSQLLALHKLALNTRCGERGLCDGCLIELVGGRLIHCQTGKAVEPVDGPLTLRGCEYQTDPDAPASIRLPHQSMLAHRPQVVTSFKLNVSAAHNPIAPMLAPSGKHGLGVAIDIGTTTVALLLVDLANGRVVGKHAGFNNQIALGDNVLTRINLCMTDPTMLSQLQQAVTVGTLNPLLTEMLAAAGAAPEQVTGVTVAANTTMLHLLAGVDPSPMGVSPFTARFLEHKVVGARSIHLAAGEGEAFDPPVHLLPGAAAYVGADLTAGALASGLIYEEGPSLLVDVGTNGEIILKHAGKFYGCATAAGPAFEGAGLTSGMRAADGAISHIRMTDHPFSINYQVIGDVPATGICGSGFIDFLAQARAAELLSVTGRYAETISPEAAATLCPRGRKGKAMTLAQAERPVVMPEGDIAKLLQAKAAIAAGILTLLERLNLTPSQIKTLHLAGGFGMHVDIHSAIGSGLLPGFAPEQIKVVGNSALAGAYLALLDKTALAEIARLGREIEVIELNADPLFESRFIEQLMLPG